MQYGFKLNGKRVQIYVLARKVESVSQPKRQKSSGVSHDRGGAGARLPLEWVADEVN